MPEWDPIYPDSLLLQARNHTLATSVALSKVQDSEPSHDLPRNSRNVHIYLKQRVSSRGRGTGRVGISPENLGCQCSNKYQQQGGALSYFEPETGRTD